MPILKYFPCSFLLQFQSFRCDIKVIDIHLELVYVQDGR